MLKEQKNALSFILKAPNHFRSFDPKSRNCGTVKIIPSHLEVGQRDGQEILARFEKLMNGRIGTWFQSFYVLYQSAERQV